MSILIIHLGFKTCMPYQIILFQVPFSFPMSSCWCLWDSLSFLLSCLWVSSLVGDQCMPWTLLPSFKVGDQRRKECSHYGDLITYGNKILSHGNELQKKLYNPYQPSQGLVTNLKSSMLRLK